MPMIDVYAKEGTFADKHALAQNLAAAVMRWERVPDPHGFLIHFRNEVHRVMALAGDRADCVAYPMGNHVIAERMFRRDPRATMYGPLHMVIWKDQDGDASLTVDRLSKQFASFEISEIAEVGIELDRKLAALLDALEVPVPSELEQ